MKSSNKKSEIKSFIKSDFSNLTRKQYLRLKKLAEKEIKEWGTFLDELERYYDGFNYKKGEPDFLCTNKGCTSCINYRKKHGIKSPKLK